MTRLGEPSIFTSAVVRGLRSGEADRDADQQISVDELYDYVFDAVRAETPNQTPGKWSNVEGTLVIAHSPNTAPRSPALPAELRAAIEDERSFVRAAAIEQLAELMAGSDRDQARAAEQALRRLADDDSRRVSAAAALALGVASSDPTVGLAGAAAASERSAATGASERAGTDASVATTTGASQRATATGASERAAGRRRPSPSTVRPGCRPRSSPAAGWSAG